MQRKALCSKCGGSFKSSPKGFNNILSQIISVSCSQSNHILMFKVEKKLVTVRFIYLPDIQTQKLICQLLKFTWDIVLSLANQKSAKHTHIFV